MSCGHGYENPRNCQKCATSKEEEHDKRQADILAVLLKIDERLARLEVAYGTRTEPKLLTESIG